MTDKDFENKLAKDDRFNSISTDPKFMNLYNHKKKVKIDKERFGKMMTSSKFQVSSTKVDKRGRRLDKTSVNKELQKFYEEDDEPSKKQDEKKPSILDEEGNFVWLQESDSSSDESDSPVMLEEDEEEIEYSDAENAEREDIEGYRFAV